MPLLWSLVRLRGGMTRGWDDPAGRWRRAVRPWAATAAAVGAATLVLGPGDFSGADHPLTDDIAAGADVRRDPHSPGHPRALRVSLEYPTSPSEPRGPYDLFPHEPAPFRLGDRTRGVQLERENGLRADFEGHVSYANPSEVVRQGGTRVALDLSLWYALLPAAVWSGVVLWRSRRLRPGRTRASGLGAG